MFQLVFICPTAIISMSQLMYNIPLLLYIIICPISFVFVLLKPFLLEIYFRLLCSGKDFKKVLFIVGLPTNKITSAFSCFVLIASFICHYICCFIYGIIGIKSLVGIKGLVVVIVVFAIMSAVAYMG